MSRINISSGAQWEDLVGYSRAVRIGNQIEVSGCVAIKDGQLVGKGDAYLQAKRCIEILIDAVEQAGGSASDIARTRMFVTDITRDWEAVGKAHAEAFKDIKPGTSMIGGCTLINPDYLVEIEATAIISD